MKETFIISWVRHKTTQQKKHLVAKTETEHGGGKECTKANRTTKNVGMEEGEQTNRAAKPNKKNGKGDKTIQRTNTETKHKTEKEQGKPT